MQVMTNKRIRHFPVYNDGKLAGLVSIGDVVRHRVQDLELEKNVLRDAYIAARSRPLKKPAPVIARRAKPGVAIQ